VINQPQLLIADEPTTALDVSIQSQLIQLLLKLRNQLNMSILMISHDLPLISQIADHINIMYCGKIVESAPTTALLSHPLHPYTQGLLFSLSSSSAKWERIPVIEGNICDPSHKPSGCYFHPRCPKATSLCRNEYPALLEYENRHVTSCHHVSD
ncbi:MAG: ABC transporter ATP-binding protein, partial [Candidatus Aureabacteria bacterium]|nr:ABC transporter ATP-binding protein [Candidatus Auribacterota bacterium]